MDFKGFFTIALAMGVAYAESQAATSIAIPMQSSALGPLFNITVGTPPQPLTVLSDWTWMSLFTRTANCLGNYDIPICIPAGQQWFNEKRSSSFNGNTEYSPASWTNTSFLPDGEFAVTYGQDTACLGDICIPDTIMQLSAFDIAIPSALPFGGIAGLAPVLPGADASSFPLSYQGYLGSEMGSQVGFHSCASLESTESCGGGDMQAVFGGTAEGVYDAAEMVWFDVQAEEWLADSAPLSVRPGRNNFWAVQWTGMWIGDAAVGLRSAEQQGGIPLAVFDEGSEGYNAPVPASALDTLLSLTDATVQADGETYSVPCDGLPELRYELDGKQNYTIFPEMYVSQSEGGCALDVRVWDFESNGPMGLFGRAFLEPLYVVLDFEALRVGLAPLA